MKSNDTKQKGQTETASKTGGTMAQILHFAGTRRILTYLGCTLVGISMLFSMVPYICVWQVVNGLIAVAPNWANANDIASYGWIAFAFSIIGIVVYFLGLMCTHLAAFRIQTNVRKECSERLMHVPLGYFDSHASGLLRRRIDVAAGQIEQLFAHNLADISGSLVMFVTTIVLLFVFDWRMGLACFAAMIVSLICMATMMSGKNAGLMSEYQTALDDMSKSATEYVRGIPVLKVFQQTVYSFRAFKKAIDAYSECADKYQREVCETKQSINLTFTEAVFVFLIPVVLLLLPQAISDGNLVLFASDFAFYAIFSAIISTALAKIMFASGGMMQANDAISRINKVMTAPQIPISKNPQTPKDSSVVFDHVCFTYEGAANAALNQVSFSVEQGQTIALVGPSGGGKTTAASLIPRFWDVQSGSVKVGGVDVKEIDPHVLMDQVAFVFQNNRLFKASIFENVRAARPNATREEVMQALQVAQCDDIIKKLPQGIDSLIGTGGTYLSGGEQQRVMLARAILKDAPIVVLDEATAFTDPENEVLIQKAFTQLAKGRTVIMIAHRLSTVRNADKIIVLENGHLIEEGTHDTLVEQCNLYAKMWSDYQTSVSWKIRKEEA